MNMCKDCGRVRLIPYENQVSGHHKVMLFDESTICKPVIAKEFEFYESFPPTLRKFIPEFKGLARASTDTDTNGVTHMYASKMDSDNNSCHNEKMQTGVCKICNNQESEITNGNSKVKCKWKSPSFKDSTREDIYEANPWVIKVQKLSFEQNMYKAMDSIILLEHIGQQFRRPCVLDLKMGTRQHGDGATDRKIKDHEERCQQSTSKSLGVRLCGMQVYDPATSCYSYIDKYTGRNLDPSGFRSILNAFVLNGKRMDVITPFTKLLEELYQVVEKLNSYRFFCCSLLLMYDGELRRINEHAVEVRMIDFSHVTLYGENSEHCGPDAGYLFGLSNLTRMFNDIEMCSKDTEKT